tara:strand:+ start:64 stop:1023 length:960 start_codon:yes stop_codon:yes gene_type:complete
MTDQYHNPNQNNNHHYDNDEIDISKLVSVLLKNKKKFFLITSLVFSISVIGSLFLPNKYTSTVILAPSEDSSNLSNLAKQYSGIASMAGLSLPSAGEADKVAMGVETIKSLNFFEQWVNNNDLLFLLMAPKGWDRNTDTLIIDRDIYDTDKQIWVSDIKFSIAGKPTIQTAHRQFLKENFAISRDSKTGFVTISITHFSPFVAKKLLDLLIFEVNEISRNDDMEKAKRSIEFLEKEITGTQLAEIRSGLNELIQNQIETIMIANASPEYLLKILSAPIAPEKKSTPRRSIIAIFGLFFGIFLSIFVILLQEYISSKEID